MTPAFLLSLVTVAAMPHCSLTIMEVGGSKLGVNVTVMAGSIEFWLPQAARRTIRAKVIGTKASWRNVIEGEGSLARKPRSRLQNCQGRGCQ